MRGGRMMMVIGLLVLVGAAVIGGIMVVTNILQPEPDIPVVTEDGTPGYVPPPPEDMTRIVVAAQPVIPQGTRITEDAVALADRAKSTVPEGTLTILGDAVGRVAREDIAQDTPITADMLTDLPALTGSDAALLVPSGKVAYALAVAGNSSVAWAIQPGDHVDVLISLLIIEIDEEFQSELPNALGCIPSAETQACIGALGRIEVLPNGEVVNAVPREEDQRPRLVTQMTLQDVKVLRVGAWSTKAEPLPGEEPVGEAVEGEGTVQDSVVKWLTLIVTPQDALVLKYAEETGASIDLVLRSAQDRDKGLVTTEAVTLQYVMDRFNIEVPPLLPYGVDPPIMRLRPGAAGEVVSAEGGMELEYSRLHSLSTEGEQEH